MFDEDERERRVLGLIWKFTIVKIIASVLPCISLKNKHFVKYLQIVDVSYRRWLND